MPSRPLTILFMPESAYGPTNNCIGIGDVLRKRGHRVVFAAEASWKGKLEPLGFEEDLVDLAARRPRATRTPGSSGRTSSPRRRRSSASRRSSSWTRGSSRSGRSSSAAPGTATPQLQAIVERASPDVIVEDNVVGFPALVTAGVPFVRIVSCNPLEIKAPDVPPAFSGYPAAGRAGWAEFRAEYDRVHRAAVAGLQRLGTRRRAPRPARPGIHRRGRRQPLRLPGAGRLPAGAGRSGRPGTGSTPRSARPTRASRCRPRSPAATGR